MSQFPLTEPPSLHYAELNDDQILNILKTQLRGYETVYLASKRYDLPALANGFIVKGGYQDPAKPKELAVAVLDDLGNDLMSVGVGGYFLAKGPIKIQINLNKNAILILFF